MLQLYLLMLDSGEEQNKFERLYHTCGQLLFYVAYSILRDKQAAEDAVHHAFLKVLENFLKIGEVNCHKTRSYLVIIVRNTAINMAVKRKRREGISMDAEDFCEGSLGKGEDAAELGCVERAIAELPVLLGDVLKLKYVQGYSNEEIARALNLKKATVRKRLERAREKLREALEEEGITVG